MNLHLNILNHQESPESQACFPCLQIILYSGIEGKKVRMAIKINYLLLCSFRNQWHTQACMI